MTASPYPQGPVPDPRNDPVAPPTAIEALRADVAAQYAPWSSADNRRNAVDLTPLSDMQTGHGWTGSGAGDGVVWNLNDTSDYAVGSQCISGVTSGAGTSRYIRKTGLTYDLADNDLLIWIKCDDFTHLQEIGLTIASGTFTNIRTVPIFDSSTSDGTVGVSTWRAGEWSPVRIPATRTVATSGSLTLSSCTEMQIEVDDDGTGNPVTVKFGGVFLVPHPTKFPNGVVTVSFDDSNLAEYTIARPILARRGFAATSYVIPSRCDGVIGPTAAQYRILQNGYGWDIQAHGDTNYTTLTAAELVSSIVETKSWIRENGLGAADHVAYPNGGQDADTDEVVGRFFATGRTVITQLFDSMRPGNPLRMRAVLVQSSVSTATVQAYIDACYDRPCWLHLVFHNLVASGATGADYTTANFTTVIDYLHTKGIPVLPFADVWRSISPA